jgi:hypothetical protein
MTTEKAEWAERRMRLRRHIVRIMDKLRDDGEIDESAMLESVVSQLAPAVPAAKPPSHGRGWPQVCVPDSTAHVMGGDPENSPPDQCKEEPIGSVG